MPASEQGVNLERYMQVPRTLVFLTRGNKVLLIRGAEDKRLWRGLYNGVGGHVEQGEDLLSATRREIREETGLTPSILWLCGIITIDTQTNPGVCVFVFKGECLEGEPKISGEGALEWINASETDHLPLVADLPLLLPKILNSGSNDAPFIAHSKYNEAGDLVSSFV